MSRSSSTSEVPVGKAQKSENRLRRFRGMMVCALPVLLAVAAGSILLVMLVKALVDVDGHADTWWYHLPWAARLAGLIPADEYLFEPLAAARFEGFPLLAELLQGMLWRWSGRVEAANLVSFSSLVLYVLLLRHYFLAPWYLSALAFLGVPLVQAHATSSYVDLPANLALATLVMLTFLAYLRRDATTDKTVFVMFASAAAAANMKLQLIPLVALTLLFTAYPVLSRWWRESRSAPRRWPIAARMLMVAFAVGLVFLVPLKNIVVHGNPAYPLKLEVAGVTLKHSESVPWPSLQDKQEGSRSQPEKWVMSVFEIGMGPVFDVRRWNLDSSPPPGSPLAGRQGGYFGLYVVLHLGLFLALLFRVDLRHRVLGMALVGIMTVTTMAMPNSHLLRYYLFWMVCLISLNLILLVKTGSRLALHAFGVMALAVVLVVIDATDQNFFHPKFYSLQQLIDDRTDPRILAEIQDGDAVCLVLEHPYQPFAYAAIFHPPARYTLQAGPRNCQNETAVAQTCGDLRIIRSPPCRLPPCGQDPG